MSVSVLNRADDAMAADIQLPAPQYHAIGSEDIASEDLSRRRNESKSILNIRSDAAADREADIRSRWPGENYKILSELGDSLSLADTTMKTLIEQCRLLRLHPDEYQPYPLSLADLRRAEQEVGGDVNVTEIRCPILPPTAKDGSPMCTGPGFHVLCKLDLKDVLFKLFSEEEHCKHAVFRFTPKFAADGSRIYDELWTAEWFEEQQMILIRLGVEDPLILAIVIASDATSMTWQGRNVHPVYFTSGSLHREYRQQRTGRHVYAYIPMVEAVKSHSGSAKIVTYRRHLLQWCVSELTRDLREWEHGVALNLGLLGVK
jgi:hypothetical protein